MKQIKIISFLLLFGLLLPTVSCTSEEKEKNQDGTSKTKQYLRTAGIIFGGVTAITGILYGVHQYYFSFLNTDADLNIASDCETDKTFQKESNIKNTVTTATETINNGIQYFKRKKEEFMMFKNTLGQLRDRLFPNEELATICKIPKIKHPIKQTLNYVYRLIITKTQKAKESIQERFLQIDTKNVVSEVNKIVSVGFRHVKKMYDDLEFLHNRDTTLPKKQDATNAINSVVDACYVFNQKMKETILNALFCEDVTSIEVELPNKEEVADTIKTINKHGSEFLKNSGKRKTGYFKKQQEKSWIRRWLSPQKKTDQNLQRNDFSNINDAKQSKIQVVDSTKNTTEDTISVEEHSENNVQHSHAELTSHVALLNELSSPQSEEKTEQQ